MSTAQKLQGLCVPFALILILLMTACSHFSPRTDRYGLPELDYTYRQPDKTGDGWETASINDVGAIRAHFIKTDDDQVDHLMVYLGLRGLRFDKIK